MLRKSITVLVILILAGTFLGPLGNVNAQASQPDCPPFDPALLRNKEYLQTLAPECATAYQKTARQNLQAMDVHDVVAETPSQAAPDAQSTTGPTPPAGAVDPKSVTYVPSPNSVVVSGVPAYIWHDGCGPTAAGMLIGYWDQTYDWLIDGSAATQTAAVDEAIASHDGIQNHYDDYALPMDDSEPSPLPDKSEAPFGDEHADNSIADFMKTSQSYHSNQYGWSWASAVGPALTSYVGLVRPSIYLAASDTVYYSDDGSYLWNSLITEIDAGRPMIFLVDSSGDGWTDHFITIVGYDEVAGVKKYAAYNTWDTSLHWYDFGPMTNGKAWGVWGGFTFNITPGGGPDAFGYTYDDTVGYDWVSASTDSGLSGDDDYMGPIDLGFNFPFYGLTQTQFYVSTNGVITFGAGEYGYGGDGIPDVSDPNNFIAPFWEDLLVGSPDNAGGIYFSQGGSAPNRYFVVEWRDVTTYNGSSPFSFEAILYENGDVIFQYQSLPGSYYSTVGIENSLGDEGLQVQSGSSGLDTLKAVHFYYPTTPAAHMLVSPLGAGSFSTPGGTSDFSITVTNTGSLGADVYDILVYPNWPVTLYAADGVTPLTDTDGDLEEDTGSVPQEGSVTITVRVEAPADAQIGDLVFTGIVVTSSLNEGVNKVVNLQNTVPAPFAQGYESYGDRALGFMTVRPSARDDHKITQDGYYGNSLAMAQTLNGAYLYAWNKYGLAASEIEYALVRQDGSLLRPISKLRELSSAVGDEGHGGGGGGGGGDYAPAVAVAPNGMMGIAWYYYHWDAGYNQNIYDIYFAVLNSQGDLFAGPFNVTNNTDPAAFRYSSPSIAATSDNRFVVAWENYDRVSYAYNIEYAVYNAYGAKVRAMTVLTDDGYNYDPILNSLTGGKVILTWRGIYDIPTYAVINSSGGLTKSATSLGVTDVFESPDAVALPGGKVAVAWGTATGVGISILNSAYDVEMGPANFDNLYSSEYNSSVSVTTDIDGHIIVTWKEDYPYRQLFYVMTDESFTIPAIPMPYKSDPSGLEVSWNGQGNAPLTTFGDVPPTNWAAPWIERLYAAGITGGCSVGAYCPDSTTTRAQMAVFLLVAEHGTGYTPPDAVGMFNDVPADNGFAKWVEQLAAEGITGGCGGGNYCPNSPVTRAQMAVFLLVAKNGPDYTPPAATGVFADVPAGDLFAPWIEALAAEGITGGCGGGNFCPSTPVTRAQMAVFLVTAFNLP